MFEFAPAVSEKEYITWSPNVSVSYPLGISFSAWPTGASKIDTTSVYTDFTVN